MAFVQFQTNKAAHADCSGVQTRQQKGEPQLIAGAYGVQQQQVHRQLANGYMGATHSSVVGLSGFSGGGASWFMRANSGLF